MKRSILLYAWVVLAGSLGCSQTTPAKVSFDLVIRNGTLIDGTGEPARVGDVAIKGDRIVAIGAVPDKGQTEIDATGKVVSPGFIDVQGQSGVTLLVDGNGESHIRQGITTEIIGEGSTPGLWTAEHNDAASIERYKLAFDWQGFGGYLKAVEKKGTSLNVGSFAPVAQLRERVVGMDDRLPTADELTQMEGILDEAMRGGAFGLASALIYPPASYTSTGELVSLARVAAKYGGTYISHVRGESFRVNEAVDEALQIGLGAGLPVVIYHIKVGAKANWGQMPQLVARIERARAQGLDVTACQYPYMAGGTNLPAVLPGWAQEGGREKMLQRLKNPAERARMRRDIEKSTEAENLLLAATFEGIQIASVPPERDQSIVGKRIAEIASERKMDPWETLFALISDNDGRVGALFHMMSEEDVTTAMKLPWVSVGTDSAAIRPDGPLGLGQPHPRAYGTFPRILGHYVRDQKVLELPAAIRKMTGLAAMQMKLRNRGLLRNGYFADVVILDPMTVGDTNSYEKPQQYPTGIETVIVNGVVTVKGGQHTGAHAGRALYGPGVPTGR